MDVHDSLIGRRLTVTVTVGGHRVGYICRSLHAEFLVCQRKGEAGGCRDLLQDTRHCLKSCWQDYKTRCFRACRTRHQFITWCWVSIGLDINDESSRLKPSASLNGEDKWSSAPRTGLTAAMMEAVARRPDQWSSVPLSPFRCTLEKMYSRCSYSHCDGVGCHSDEPGWANAAPLTVTLHISHV